MSNLSMSFFEDTQPGGLLNVTVSPHQVFREGSGGHSYSKLENLGLGNLGSSRNILHQNEQPTKYSLY